ncbi:MAG: S53 family peptidase, partial [Schlesneria sp.]
MVRHSWLKALRQLINGTRGYRASRRPRLTQHWSVVSIEIQALESRRLLSGAPAATGTPPVQPIPKEPTDFILAHPFGAVSSATSTPTGITPAQMRQAYGMNTISFGGVAGDGSGQTIAIVDAYNNPNIISDLSGFDAYFGLSDPPSFNVLNEFGGTNLPGKDPFGKGGWSVEEALDVEWAHVMAPKANLILFEAASQNPSDLFTAVDTARNTAGVSVVSMSFGYPEYQYYLDYYDSYFLTPNGHQGVTFVASTGDSGAGVAYPAASPNVVSVGGTTLTVDSSGNYIGETGWSGSGGGYSFYESEPAYQRSVQSSGSRTNPDVSMDADPNTGVPVYDTYDFGSTTPWEEVGGTSLSAPMFGGVMAVVDQGRVLTGHTTLDGATQT